MGVGEMCDKCGHPAYKNGRCFPHQVLTKAELRQARREAGRDAHYKLLHLDHGTPPGESGQITDYIGLNRPAKRHDSETLTEVDRVY